MTAWRFSDDGQSHNRKNCIRSAFASRSTNFSLLFILIYSLVSLLQIRAQTPDLRQGQDLHVSSPYEQHLPECSQSFPRVKKITKEKAIVCPMFRDEEGFLAEWIAYYQLHGFDHVMLFDDGSVDNYREEIAPWLASGFVSLRGNWTMDSIEIHPGFTKNEFKRTMTTKALLERACKKQAQEWGYKYFASLDIDEYIIVADTPESPDYPLSIVDALDRYYTGSAGKGSLCIDKYNFASTPHLLEPVNLLQIEAYQTRMAELRRMSYYTTVQPKCTFVLQGGQYYDENTPEYVARCCHFHGCHGHDPVRNSTFCRDQDKIQKAILNKGGWPGHLMSISHYSRSVEKYFLKGQTWRTSGGEVKSGEDMVAVAKDYDINKFFQRNLGWKLDRQALKYSCHLREVLAQATGQIPFQRAGTVWYRNAEFGRLVSVPDKRGRYGRPNPVGYHFKDNNPHHYHGGKSNDAATNTGGGKKPV
jgi:hypothetical protein